MSSIRESRFSGECIDLETGRRRHDGHAVSAAPVGLHERARLGVDLGGEALSEDAFADLGELVATRSRQPITPRVFDTSSVIGRGQAPPGSRYVPHHPEQTILYQTVSEQLETFLARSLEPKQA